MVECMISLVIAASLLTAVGIAFTSTAHAMQYNDEFFRATQSGRVSMARILSQVRNSSVDEASTANNLHLITNEIKDSNGNVIVPAKDLTYKIDTATSRLVMVNNGTGVTYELAKNVTTAVTATSPFTIDLGKDYNNTTCVSRVSVTLAVAVGVNEVRLYASAAPRRNLNY